MFPFGRRREVDPVGADSASASRLRPSDIHAAAGAFPPPALPPPSYPPPSPPRGMPPFGGPEGEAPPGFF